MEIEYPENISEFLTDENNETPSDKIVKRWCLFRSFHLWLAINDYPRSRIYFAYFKKHVYKGENYDPSKDYDWSVAW